MDPAGTASSFTLEELTGDKRVLELRGRALPFRPISFPGVQRYNKSANPGNPVATVQVFGPEEEDTTVKGVWHNRFLGIINWDTGNYVANPEAQVFLTDPMGMETRLTSCIEIDQVVTDIRRKGQLLKVTWGPIVRYGLLAKYVPSWDREQDLAWEMTFAWVSIDDPLDLITIVPLVINVTDWWSRLWQAWGDLKSAISEFAAKMNSYINEVNAAISKLEDSIQGVFDAINGLANAVMSPIATAQRLMAVCTRLSMQAQEVLDTLESRVPWGSSSSMAGDVGPAKNLPDIDALGMGDRIVADLQYRKARRAVRQIQAEAANQAQESAKQVNPNLLACFMAREGMDLREVSRRYYGTADKWRDLARFNENVGSALSAGQYVLVPRREQLQSQISSPVLAVNP